MRNVMHSFPNLFSAMDALPLYTQCFFTENWSCSISDISRQSKVITDAHKFPILYFMNILALPKMWILQY